MLKQLLESMQNAMRGEITERILKQPKVVAPNDCDCGSCLLAFVPSLGDKSEREKVYGGMVIQTGQGQSTIHPIHRDHAKKFFEDCLKSLDGDGIQPTYKLKLVTDPHLGGAPMVFSLEGRNHHVYSVKRTDGLKRFIVGAPVELADPQYAHNTDVLFKLAEAYDEGKLSNISLSQNRLDLAAIQVYRERYPHTGPIHNDPKEETKK